MASLYFADQRARSSVDPPTRSRTSSRRTESLPATVPNENNNNNPVVGEMSYVGDDGIREEDQLPLPTPVPPPPPPDPDTTGSYAKTDEITGDVILEAEVEPIGYDGQQTVSSDITENTGRAGPPGIPPLHTTSINGGDVRQGGGVGVGGQEGANNANNSEEQALSNRKNRSSSTEGNDNRRFWIVFSIVCCIIVAGGAGAGVGIALSSKNNNDDPTDSSEISSPTAAPVKPPPTPIKDTSSPTAPITNDPTTEPTDPAPPVDNPDVPINDQCNAATLISTVTSTFGSTEFASPHPELDTICEVDGISKAVWYRVNGIGALLEASTCGDTEYDTKISIFSGNCNSLECVAFNDDSPDDTECQSQIKSTAVWPSEQGTTYYIMVHGFETAAGEFELSVREKPLENDNCDGAIAVTPDGTFEFGTTISAELDFVGSCDVDTTAPGVWYTFIGTGEPLVVHTCTGSDYDTALTVYEGNCGGLVCIRGNDDFPGCGLQSRVVIESQLGQSYSVLIHGYNDESGTFALYVGPEDSLYNDKCIDGVPLRPGDYFLGNTELASYDFVDPGRCDISVEFSGPTVWYHVVGTGATLTVSLCDAATDYDTQISVFKGSCFQPTCLGGNDDGPEECGRTSEFTWLSELFENYFVAIHGFGNETGSFGVFLDEAGDGPDMSTCSGAGGPFSLGETVEVALTDSATIDSGNLDCGPASGSETPVSAGVWLYAGGDGGILSASVCNNNPPGTSLIVFSGTCGSLACVQPTSSSDCETEWESESGITYYMFVEGASPGRYEISTTSTAGDPDTCVGAVPLGVNQEVVIGSTIGANIDDVLNGVCGVEIDSAGVWYQVIGQGSVMAVSLCDPNTNYDTKLSVFSGDCDNLVCVGGNDDHDECSNFQSAFEWNPIAGERYYILVHGWGGETGNFGLQVLSG